MFCIRLRPRLFRPRSILEFVLGWRRQDFVENFCPRAENAAGKCAEKCARKTQQESTSCMEKEPNAMKSRFIVFVSLALTLEAVVALTVGAGARETNTINRDFIALGSFSMQL